MIPVCGRGGVDRLPALSVLGLALLLGFGAMEGAAAQGRPPAHLPTPIETADRRELFVDNYLIDRMIGCELRLHHPIPRAPALVHDARWEGNLSCYHTVFRDGERYRMYYRGTALSFARGVRKKHEDFTCYAESDDGIRWRKPELGIVEFAGSKKNNIILGGYPAHNFAPFLDTNPKCPPDRRYKAFGGHQKKPGLYAFVSPDGVHWQKLTDPPVLTDGAFDSQNLAFWDSVREEYRAYFRDFRRIDGVRLRDIKTAVSKDFVTWSKPEWCRYPGAPDEQLYTNQATPYPRAPHVFVAFPNRYVDHGGRWSAWRDAHNHWPGIEERKQRFSAASNSRRYGTAVSDGLFMTSRDGRTFKRWRAAFLRPRPGSWAYADSMFAWQLVETESSIPGAPSELSLYALEGGWTGHSTTLRRYTLRLDGFVSVHAGADEAEMVTKPFTFGGKALELNVATSAVGYLEVGIHDENGVPVPGFALRDCPAIVGDSVARTVSWDGGTDLGKLAGKTIRLRFVLADADLYAMQFLPEVPKVAFTPRFPAQAAVDRYLDARTAREAAHRALWTELWEKEKAAAEEEGRKPDNKIIGKLVGKDPRVAALTETERALDRELRSGGAVVPGYTRTANTMVNERIRRILTDDANARTGKLTPKGLTEALLAALEALPEQWPFTRPEYRAGVIDTFKSIARNVAVIPRCGRPPAIDGAVSEEEWGGSLEIADFAPSLYLHEPGLSKKLTGTTSRDIAARMAYDDRALYVCFICRQWARRPGFVDASRERDGSVWSDDSVGIVLQPRLSDRKAYRVFCNAEQVCYDALGTDAAWNGEQELAVRKDEKAKQWVLEMALPWSDFGVSPLSGTVVRCNVNRYRNPVGAHWWHHLKLSGWTALPFGIDDPPPYDLPLGVLILE